MAYVSEMIAECIKHIKKSHSDENTNKKLTEINTESRNVLWALKKRKFTVFF